MKPISPPRHIAGRRGEMDLLAQIAGLRLIDRFANWQRTPFDAHSNAHVSVYGLDKRP
ncbi:MAG: hypothetical protein ACOYNY_07830 [Caldilineaceae bacterium]